MQDGLVIYHADCYDGFTAAWVANRKFPGVELLPANYGDVPPDVTGRDVFVVDFSYPREVMLEMFDQAQDLVVLDHHKTSQEDCEDLRFCVFDMDKSGAGLAWDFFFDPTKRHWLVDAIEDRDLWRFAIPTTRPIHAYVSSLDMTLHNWDTLARYELGTVLECGAAIERSIQQYCKKVTAAGAFELDLWGYHAVVCNAPYLNCSELAHHMLAEHPEAELSVTLYQNKLRESVYSLRSREGGNVDVASIAEGFGGGGHARAAGFRLRLNLFTTQADAEIQRE